MFCLLLGTPSSSWLCLLLFRPCFLSDPLVAIDFNPSPSVFSCTGFWSPVSGESCREDTTPLAVLHLIAAVVAGERDGGRRGSAEERGEKEGGRGRRNTQKPEVTRLLISFLTCMQQCCSAVCSNSGLGGPITQTKEMAADTVKENY